MSSASATEHVASMSRACREHVASMLAELKPFVESFMKQDIDGQELRYFENRDGKRSLEEQAVVNLPLIQAAVRELRNIFDRLMERVARLSQSMSLARGLRNAPERT